MPIKIFYYIIPFTCLVPAIVGIRHYASLTKDLKIITLYVLVCFLTEIPTNYLRMHNMNNLFLLHLFTIIEFLLMAWLYSFHILRVINKKVILAITVTFIVFAVLNTLFFQSLSTFNSYARCIEILLIIFFALAYVYELIVRNEQKLLKALPMYWINTAVLIYFTAGFFLYLVSNNILLPTYINKSIWFVHGLLLCGFYFAIAKAIWIQAKQRV